VPSKRVLESIEMHFHCSNHLHRVVCITLLAIAFGCRERPFVRCRPTFAKQPVLAEPDSEQVIGPQGFGYLQSGPTLTGDMLMTNETPTATDRALKLREELDLVTATNRELEQQVENLTQALASKNREVRELEKGIEMAESEMAKTQDMLQEGQLLIEQLRRRLITSQDRQFEELEELSRYVQKLIEDYDSKPPAPQPLPQLETLPAPRVEGIESR
jgi:hypothetical protein